MPYTCFLLSISQILVLIMSLQMNYAIVIMFFVFVVSLSYWFIAGRKYYTGPRTQAHIVNGMIVKEPSESELRDREQAITVG